MIHNQSIWNVLRGIVSIGWEKNNWYFVVLLPFFAVSPISFFTLLCSAERTLGWSCRRPMYDTPGRTWWAIRFYWYGTRFILLLWTFWFSEGPTFKASVQKIASAAYVLQHDTEVSRIPDLQNTLNAENHTTISTVRCSCSSIWRIAVSKTQWSRIRIPAWENCGVSACTRQFLSRWDSNPGPSVCETATLPIELSLHSNRLKRNQDFLVESFEIPWALGQSRHRTNSPRGSVSVGGVMTGFESQHEQLSCASLWYEKCGNSVPQMGNWSLFPIEEELLTLSLKNIKNASISGPICPRLDHSHGQREVS